MLTTYQLMFEMTFNNMIKQEYLQKDSWSEHVWAPPTHHTVNTPDDKNRPAMLTTPLPLWLYLPHDRPGLYV